MGASAFTTRARGKTAKEAFNAAHQEACWDYGHAGYTGTIAEKRSFTMITVPAGEDPHAYADRLIEEDDPRIADKWGPAGCIQLAVGEYLFFGWASS